MYPRIKNMNLKTKKKKPDVKELLKNISIHKGKKFIRIDQKNRGKS